MAGEVRQRMIDGAIALLATRGLEGTASATCWPAPGSAARSVRYHFPAARTTRRRGYRGQPGPALDLLDAAAGSSAIGWPRYSSVPGGPC